VTVNSVLPGPTLSAGLAEILRIRWWPDNRWSGAATVKAIGPSSIIQRAASVEEVANMIVYAC
jgi:hypothetical protein